MGHHCTIAPARILTALVISALAAATAPAGPLQIPLTSTATTSLNNSGSTALLDFSFFENASGDFLNLTLTNTSSNGSKLTAVGLETPALSTLPIFVSSTGSFFDELDQNVSISPPKFDASGGYDLMITSDNNFQGGSSSGALAGGQSETVTLFLGNLAQSPADLATLFSSFYAGEVGPYAVARFQGGASDIVVAVNVPEPATLAVLCCGVSLLARRRKTLL